MVRQYYIIRQLYDNKKLLVTSVKRKTTKHCFINIVNIREYEMNMINVLYYIVDPFTDI